MYAVAHCTYYRFRDVCVPCTQSLTASIFESFEASCLQACRCQSMSVPRRSEKIRGSVGFAIPFISTSRIPACAPASRPPIAQTISQTSVDCRSVSFIHSKRILMKLANGTASTANLSIVYVCCSFVLLRPVGVSDPDAAPFVTESASLESRFGAFVLSNRLIHA